MSRTWPPTNLIPPHTPPARRCVLRIRADDPGARVPLGLKYGAEVEEAAGLLAEAKQLGLEVVGVSFHVGSAAKNLATFTNAIANARKVGGLLACLPACPPACLPGGGHVAAWSRAVMAAATGLLCSYGIVDTPETATVSKQNTTLPLVCSP